MITEIQAADVVTYLVAIGATTAKDGQGQAWADWINDEVPGVQPSELLEAVRLSIRIWKRQGRAYQVDATHFSDALKQLRENRLEKAEHMSPILPDGLGDEPLLERRWINAVKDSVCSGVPRMEAEAHAWKMIDRTPPPIDPPTQHPGLSRHRNTADKAPTSPADTQTPTDLYPSMGKPLKTPQNAPQ